MPRSPFSKYKAIRTEVDGIRFASKREAARYVVLRDKQARGEISGLELQPRYTLYAPIMHRALYDGEAGQVKVAAYVADFRYTHNGAVIVEDVKGMRLPLYKHKVKHLLIQSGITVQEVR